MICLLFEFSSFSGLPLLSKKNIPSIALPVAFLRAAAFIAIAWTAIALTCGVAAAQSRIKLETTQDAYVSGRQAKQNFGGEMELMLKKNPGSELDRYGYLQFTLPDDLEPVRFAMLSCKITKPGRTAVRVESTFEQWDEKRIRWKDQPDKTKLVTDVPALAGGRLLVDVTKVIAQARRAGKRAITFVLKPKDNSDASLRLASRESSIVAQRPQLIIETNPREAGLLKMSVVYTGTKRGTFAGLSLGKTSGEQRLGKFGGWKNWRMKPTGFFRTQFVEDHWTLVDPEGYAFFGFGLNSVNDFGPLNVPQDITAIGFNHLGSWSDESIQKIPLTPRWNFVLGFQNSSAAIRRNYEEKNILPVFEPDFANYVDRRLKKSAGKYKNNPWILGHFTDNEIPFHKTTQLQESLRLASDNAQHEAAAAWLKNKYGHKVNAKDVTEDDELEYIGFVAERYYQVVTSAFKKHLPNHLVLGERLHASAKFNPHVIEATGKYCDVISINFYNNWAPRKKSLDMWRGIGKKPFMITEFYTKAADSGMQNKEGAGWIVPSQKERTLHFENFALQMLGTPHCVGFHWFRFTDDDGSNKGVFDTQYQPYEQLQGSMQNFSRQMYRLRSQLLFGNNDFNGQAN